MAKNNTGYSPDRDKPAGVYDKRVEGKPPSLYETQSGSEGSERMMWGRPLTR